jgi:hypothetical protein
LAVLTKADLEERLQKFCDNSLGHFDNSLKSACFKRLLDIRLKLNEMRPYQSFQISLWKKK